MPSSDVITSDKKTMIAGNYGTYIVEEEGTLCALASPCWNWGKFYEEGGIVISCIRDAGGGKGRNPGRHR